LATPHSTACTPYAPFEVLSFFDKSRKKVIINLVTSRLAEGIDLPQYVIDHPSLEAISRITCDLITL
jgi:hypothetical protein